RSPLTHYVVFDLETVDDLAVARRLLGLDSSVPDDTVRKAIAAKYARDDQDLSEVFLKAPFHRVVCIGALYAERESDGPFGVYVTTSFFTPQTQSEIIQDQYPVVLVDGYRLAREINAILVSKAVDCATFLAEIDAEYERQLARRSPEEVLLI